LNDRIDPANKPASAVFFIHFGDFVHRNLRPKNIIIFEQATGVDLSKQQHRQFPYAVGEPFLVGYDGIHKVEALSQMMRVEDWEKISISALSVAGCILGMNIRCSMMYTAWGSFCSKSLC